MRSLFRIGWMVSMCLVTMLIWIGCSSDEGPSNGGPPDTTPPVVASVTAVDATHVQVAFDEQISRSSAERTDHYSIVEITAAEAATRSTRTGEGPNEPERALPLQVEIAAAVLQSDGKTVLLTTGTGMSTTAYDMLVSGVSDASGNEMTGVSTTEFTGKDSSDITAPFIVMRTPRAGATGVGTSEPVIVSFSEPMADVTVLEAFSWTSSKGSVLFSIEKTDEAEYAFLPLTVIDRSTLYTVTLTGTARDWAGNSLDQTSWTFTTMNTLDTTPPTLASSVPADGAVNVSTGVTLTLTFSERINPASLENILITPNPGQGTDERSTDGRTFSFTPDEPLLENTQYLLVLGEGSFEDLSGNLNTETVTVGFTTGASFASGRIEGTLTGDVNSPGATDPTGAVVVATTTELFGEGDLDILGIAFAGANDSYSIFRLPGATYYPFAILDSNGDGVIDPERGDAFGAYGLDISAQVFTQTPVVLDAGATVTDVDFPLFDPVAITGTVVYDGGMPAEVRATLMYSVGAFDAATFDPNDPGDPVAWTQDGPLAWNPEYAMNTLDSNLQPGNYYVGAYVDVNSNGLFDPDIDPSGFFSNLQGDPLPVAVEDGGDAANVDIYLEIPATGAFALPSGTWPEPQHANKNHLSLKRLNAKLQEILRHRDGQSH